MRTLLPALLCLCGACEPAAPSRAVPNSAPVDPPPQTIARAVTNGDVEDAGTRRGCGGLVGVQRVRLQPTETGEANRFRFGTDDGALVYETQWTGDLNDDGVEDQIAVRDASGTKSVHIVLVGCGEEFALAWAGVGTSITVAPETSTVGDRAWKKLAIDAGAHAKTLEFNGQKYERD